MTRSLTTLTQGSSSSSEGLSLQYTSTGSLCESEAGSLAFSPFGGLSGVLIGVLADVPAPPSGRAGVLARVGRILLYI